jgi:hypothetical protein
VGAKSAAEDLSLLKNLSDQRVGSSATATVGRARKFVRSRNPVTVIVKIESHNLEETRIWAPPQAVSERDGSRRSDGAIDYRRDSGGATFVPRMQSTDLRKCDDLASRRRLDRAGIRTVFI